MPEPAPTRVRKLYRRFLKPDGVAAYRRHHQAVWPELEQLYRSHGITSLSCFLHDTELAVLVEYDPAVFLPAQAALAAHPVERNWQALMAGFNDPQRETVEFEEVYRL